MMESNNKVVDESHLVERNGAVDEVSEVLVEEKVTVESEGDEVLAKGIAAEMPSEVRDTIVNEGSNAENVEVSGGSLQDKEESDSIDEDEKFEEAVEAAIEDEKFEEAVEAAPEDQSAADETGRKLEVLENEDSAVQDQTDSDQFARDGTEQLEKLDTDESGKAEVMELADSDATSKTDTSIYVDQESEKSDDVDTEKPENGVLDHLNPGESLISEATENPENGVLDQGESPISDATEKPENGVLDHLNPGESLISEAIKKTYDDDNDAMTIDDSKHDETVHEELGMQDANEVKGGCGNPQKQAESYKDILLRSEKSIEVSETSGTTYSGLQDDVDTHGCNSAIPATELKGEKCSDLDEKDSLILESVDSDSKVEEGKDAPPRDTSVNGHHRETKFTIDSSSSAASAREEETKSAMNSSSSAASAREEETKSAKDSSSSAVSAREEETKSAMDSSSSYASAREEETKSANDSFSSAASAKNSSSSAATARVEVTKSATDSSSSAASATRTAAPTRPAGLGRAAPLLEPAPRAVQPPRLNGAVSRVQNQLIEESTNAEGEESDETREKLQMIRVRFLRLAHRLGQTPHNGVVAQVLYRLGLAEQLRGRNGSRVAAFSFDRASAMAEQLEAAGQEPLDFSCTIMVLGKTGVGKSATINSIFDEGKIDTDAFQIGTKKVQDVVGTVQGIKVRVIDTPGLLPSWSDQRQNEKILHSVKNFIKKTPPDIVLYLDRLDMQSRDYGDMPLLRTITNIFGSSIWFNAIVVLTHAASAPPEDSNGTATSYDVFVTQRSLVVQQAIRQAAGDMRLMNPVSLVENHSACRTNRAGQRVLPNGQVWKPHLLLLSFASKILAEANKLLKLQDSPPGRTFAHQAQSPPLPFLLSSFLQPRPQVKLPTEQFGEDDETLDDELDVSSDSEDESEYDQLPPFKCLTKAQLAKLTKEQRKAYYDELEYREKLFMRKQLKEERRRRKEFKKRQASANDLPAHSDESTEEDVNGAASVPVPIPDMPLPASFDSDNPTHRYRRLDSSNQWFVRPVLDSHGWDHDVGYEGINVERLFVVKDKIPISFSGSLSKDKKDSSLQMEIASSVNHGDGKATSLGFDMQSLGKDIAYTLRTDTKFINFRKNKATAGLSATLLGDTITGGVKVEDKFFVGKRGQVVISGGAMYGRGDVAYAGSMEATLRDKDHPLGRFLTTVGLNFMDWHGDISFGCNSQTQIPVGRHTNLIARFNLNDKGSGQVSLRLASSEQLQIALICLVPLARKILGYCQQGQ